MQRTHRKANLGHADSYAVRRHVVRVGDVVRVRPTTGRRNGFVARIRAIRVDRASGDVIEVEVYGGPPRARDGPDVQARPNSARDPPPRQRIAGEEPSAVTRTPPAGRADERRAAK